MRIFQLVFLGVFLFSAVKTNALNIRNFVSWTGEQIEEMIEFEKAISAGLKSGAEHKEIKANYDGLHKIERKSENLIEYLSDTLELSDNLVKKNGLKKYRIIDLRNRLDNIYSMWLVGYRDDLETELLNNLYQILSNAKNSSYQRVQAVMAIGIVGNQKSIQVLEKYKTDSVEDVRNYVTKNIDRLKNGEPTHKSHKDVIDSFKRPIKF